MVSATAPLFYEVIFLFKKILAILCTVVILSYSFIFVPTSKAMRIQLQQTQIEMEADASVGVIAAGITLAALVCLVLIWYGVSVNSDSTEAQSCLEFVKEKAKEARISVVALEVNAFLYLEQIGEWVADWVASWTEVYETANASCGVLSDNGSSFCIDISSLSDGRLYSSDGEYFLSFASATKIYVIFEDSDSFHFVCTYADAHSNGSSFYVTSSSGSAFLLGGDNIFSPTYSFLSSSKYSLSQYSKLADVFSYNGIHVTNYTTVDDFAASLRDNTVNYPSISADTSKQVVIPAAKDVFDGTGSLDDYQLDNPDVIDFGSALSQLQSTTGNPALTWDDVIDGVNTGEISASDVLDATDTVPYVLTDSRTGELATADTPDEYVKPVSLTDDLAIPDAQTIAETEPYFPKYDNDSDSTKKFRLPLFQYFPFCLPWDIYDALSAFDADPVAPVLEIPIGESFRTIPGVTAETTGYVLKLDLGEEQFSKWFRLLRLLESIGIIVGLVLLARALIHGGN